MTGSPTLAQELPLDPAFGRLKQHLIAATGLAYYQNKEEELAAHIVRRMLALEIRQCAEYLDRLDAGHAGAVELDTLAASLTIGETFFFRHQELFEALRDRIFPELIRRNSAHRCLRIWSAGCAIGAEAYSLAILLEREFGDRLAGWDVSILCTDINRDFLAQAQHGEFGEWSFRSVAPELRAECFVQAGAVWRVRDAFRRGVSFQYHNLVQHHFPSLVNNLSSFDLILCRNVMIYFDADVVRRLVQQFHESLVDEGFFVVGPAEPNVEVYRDFRTVNLPGVVLYQRKPAASEEAVAAAPPAFPTWEFPPFATAFPSLSRQPTPLPRKSSPRPATAVTLAAVRALLDRGNWEAAHTGCQRLEASERLNPLLYFYEALIAEQSGRHHETELALKRAIYLDRNFVLAHYYLGLARLRNGAPDAARSFRNVLALIETRDDTEILPEADGLTVGELYQLSQMQLEVLSRP